MKKRIRSLLSLTICLSILFTNAAFAAPSAPSTGEKVVNTVFYVMQGGAGIVLIVGGTSGGILASETGIGIPAGIAVDAFGACEAIASARDLQQIWIIGEMPKNTNCLSKAVSEGAKILHWSKSTTKMYVDDASTVDSIALAILAPYSLSLLDSAWFAGAAISTKTKFATTVAAFVSSELATTSGELSHKADGQKPSGGPVQ